MAFYHASAASQPASPSHVPPIVLQYQADLKSVCEDEPNCKYDQGLCSVVDPDPYAWFRSLLLIDTVLIAVKELIKVAVLLPYVCRGRVPPAALHFFCASSPLNMLLALGHRPLRVLFSRRPSFWDLALLLLADGLCEDIPQLVTQLLFVKLVSRTGLSFLQSLSLFLTALGLSVMILRSGFAMLLHGRNAVHYQVPHATAPKGASTAPDSPPQIDTSTAGCKALPRPSQALSRSPPSPSLVSGAVLDRIPGCVDAADNEPWRVSLESVGSRLQLPHESPQTLVCRSASIFAQFDIKQSPAGGCDMPSVDSAGLADPPPILIRDPVGPWDADLGRVSLESVTTDGVSPESPASRSAFRANPWPTPGRVDQDQAKFNQD